MFVPPANWIKIIEERIAAGRGQRISPHLHVNAWPRFIPVEIGDSLFKIITPRGHVVDELFPDRPLVKCLADREAGLHELVPAFAGQEQSLNTHFPQAVHKARLFQVRREDEIRPQALQHFPVRPAEPTHHWKFLNLRRIIARAGPPTRLLPTPS